MLITIDSNQDSAYKVRAVLAILYPAAEAETSLEVPTASQASEIEAWVEKLGQDAGAAIKDGPEAPELDPAQVFAANVPEGTPPAPMVIVPQPVPLPPGAVATVEYDTAGMPFDLRIHQAGRAKTIKGTWKNKKGLDKAILAAVTAELMPTVSAPVAVQPAAQPATVPVPPAPPVATVVASVPVAPPVSLPIPPAPPAYVPAQVPAAPVAIDFRGLMKKIQDASVAGKLTKADVDAALATVGLKPDELSPLVTQPLLIPTVNAFIDSKIGA